MPDAAVAQPSPGGCPFDAGLLREKNACGFFFLLLQPAPGLGSGLGRPGREQKCSSGAAGSHAGSFRKQGNRQKRSSPQTGNSLSLWGGHRKPKPFQTKETKKPALFGGDERTRSLWGCCRVASLPAGRVPTQPRAAPVRGFFLPTSENGNLIKIDARSRDLNAMSFKMRNEWK